MVNQRIDNANKNSEMYRKNMNIELFGSDEKRIDLQSEMKKQKQVGDDKFGFITYLHKRTGGVSSSGTPDALALTSQSSVDLKTSGADMILRI